MLRLNNLALPLDYTEDDLRAAAARKLRVPAADVRAVHELGRSVPRDVQVTGVGGGMVSTLVSPVLTTVRYSYEEAGEAAAKQLVELMAGRSPEKREVVPGFEVLKRASSRC